eukprot:s50_g5.t1
MKRWGAKGFGFITTPNGDDVFVLERDCEENILEGDSVVFDLENNPRQFGELMAVRVRCLRPYTGRMKGWTDRGYGYIQQPNGCRDVFVLDSNCEGAIRKGDWVRFDLQDVRGRRPMAVNVIVASEDEDWDWSPGYEDWSPGSVDRSPGYEDWSPGYEDWSPGSVDRSPGYEGWPIQTSVRCRKEEVTAIDHLSCAIDLSCQSPNRETIFPALQQREKENKKGASSGSHSVPRESDQEAKAKRAAAAEENENKKGASSESQSVPRESDQEIQEAKAKRAAAEEENENKKGASSGSQSVPRESDQEIQEAKAKRAAAEEENENNKGASSGSQSVPRESDQEAKAKRAAAEDENENKKGASSGSQSVPRESDQEAKAKRAAAEEENENEKGASSGSHSVPEVSGSSWCFPPWRKRPAARKEENKKGASFGSHSVPRESDQEAKAKRAAAAEENENKKGASAGSQSVPRESDQEIQEAKAKRAAAEEENENKKGASSGSQSVPRESDHQHKVIKEVRLEARAVDLDSKVLREAASTSPAKAEKTLREAMASEDSARLQLELWKAQVGRPSKSQHGNFLDVSSSMPMGLQICHVCDQIFQGLQEPKTCNADELLQEWCKRAKMPGAISELPNSIFGLMEPAEIKNFLEAADHRMWNKIKTNTEEFIKLLENPGRGVPWSVDEMTPQAKHPSVEKMCPVVMDQSVREPATNTPFGHTGYQKYLTLQIVKRMGFRDIAISGQYYGKSYTPETQILEWMQYYKESMDGMIVMFAPGPDDREAGLKAIKDFQVPNAFLDLTMKASIRFQQSDFVSSVLDTVQVLDEIFTGMGLKKNPWRSDKELNNVEKKLPGKGEISINLVDLMEFLDLKQDGTMNDEKRRQAEEAFQKWKKCDAFRRRVVGICNLCCTGAVFPRI